MRMRIPQPFATVRLSEWLSFGDNRNGDLHAWDANWQLCSLTCRWICREPLQPFLIQAGEVFFLKQDDGCACDLVQGAARRVEDCRNVGKALACLLLDRLSHDLAGCWIKRASS